MQRVVWEFEARPTVISREYRVRIIYRYGDYPRVYVVKPDLPNLADQRTIPHLYEQKTTRLCLYLPGAGEWSPAMFLAETIVPWSFLWLFYFEDWLATEVWKGGGMHPDPKHRRRYEKL